MWEIEWLEAQFDGAWDKSLTDAWIIFGLEIVADLPYLESKYVFFEVDVLEQSDFEYGYRLSQIVRLCTQPWLIPQHLCTNMLAELWVNLLWFLLFFGWLVHTFDIFFFFLQVEFLDQLYSRWVGEWLHLIVVLPVFFRKCDFTSIAHLDFLARSRVETYGCLGELFQVVFVLHEEETFLMVFQLSKLADRRGGPILIFEGFRGGPLTGPDVIFGVVLHFDYPFYLIRDDFMHAE